MGIGSRMYSPDLEFSVVRVVNCQCLSEEGRSKLMDSLKGGRALVVMKDTIN